MADKTYRNFVYFKGNRIALTLESDWVTRPGVKPDINSALVPYTEFDKLSSIAAMGMIEMYFDGDPAVGSSPEVRIGPYTICNIVVSRFAQLTPGGPVRAVEYRLSFADERLGWVFPRGGRLAYGEINKAPISDDGQTDANGQPTWGDDDLVAACLDAMGEDADYSWVSHDVSMLNLDWHGAHPPTELEKILSQIGGVICPDLTGGTWSIVKIGQMAMGTIPFRPDQSVPIPVADGRAAVVVFTSAPNAIIDTEIMSPGGQQFVVQHDGSGALVWDQIDNAPAMFPGGVLMAMQTGGKSLAGTTPYAAIAMNQAYRMIQLTGIAPGSVLRTGQIQVKALIAERKNGQWQNATAMTNVQVIAVYQGNVIEVADRLQQVGQPTQDLDKDFQALDPAQDIEVTVTHELHSQDAKGNWQPTFYELGFTADASGNVIQLSESDTANALSGGGAAVVRRPDMRLIRINGSAKNEKALVANAKILAQRYLAGSGTPAKQLFWRGFAPVGLDGQVCEVRWQQTPPQTIAKVGTWFQPSDGWEYLKGRQDLAGGAPARGGSEKYPKAADVAAERAASGAPGNGQPVAMVGSVAPPRQLPQGAFKVDVVSDGGEAGGEFKPCSFTYTATRDGAQIGTTMSPTAARPPMGPLAAGKTGIAYYDKTGAPQLWAVDEVEAIDPTEIVIGAYDCSSEDPRQENVESMLGKTVIAKRGWRPVYNSAGTQVLYHMFRTERIVNGRITEIGIERRVVVDQPVVCTPPGGG